MSTTSATSWVLLRNIYHKKLKTSHDSSPVVRQILLLDWKLVRINSNTQCPNWAPAPTPTHTHTHTHSHRELPMWFFQQSRSLLSKTYYKKGPRYSGRHGDRSLCCELWSRKHTAMIVPDLGVLCGGQNFWLVVAFCSTLVVVLVTSGQNCFLLWGKKNMKAFFFIRHFWCWINASVWFLFSHFYSKNLLGKWRSCF